MKEKTKGKIAEEIMLVFVIGIATIIPLIFDSSLHNESDALIGIPIVLFVFRLTAYNLYLWSIKKIFKLAYSKKVLVKLISFFIFSLVISSALFAGS